MVIKTAVVPRGPKLPSKRPGSAIIDLTREALKVSGYYNEYQLWRYDPDYLYQKHVGKYTYKPRKRVAGYLGKALHGQTKQRPKFTSRKQYEEYHTTFGWSQWNKCR